MAFFRSWRVLVDAYTWCRARSKTSRSPLLRFLLFTSIWRLLSSFFTCTPSFLFVSFFQAIWPLRPKTGEVACARNFCFFFRIIRGGTPTTVMPLLLHSNMQVCEYFKYEYVYMILNGSYDISLFVRLSGICSLCNFFLTSFHLFKYNDVTANFRNRNL